MNRRKAIGRIALAGGAGALAFSGYKWWEWGKRPDMAWLEGKKDLVAALAETIIPTTDTPGAKEAGVADYILVMVRDCTDRRSQNKFIDGLKDLESYCQSTFDQPYPQCSPEQQHEIMENFASTGKPSSGIMGKVQKRLFGQSFFSTLKELTVTGFCTSEAGATKTLEYVLIPGKYEGCMPLKPGQKSWATK